MHQLEQSSTRVNIDHLKKQYADLLKKVMELALRRALQTRQGKVKILPSMLKAMTRKEKEELIESKLQDTDECFHEIELLLNSL